MLRGVSQCVSSPAAASTGDDKSISPGHKPSGKRKVMTSSERGLKFRRKQQEREKVLLTTTAKLRREIARLQALKDIREGYALVRTFTESGSPLKFVLEYFAQFRFGVAGMSTTPVSMMTTTLSQQQAFLEAMVEPGTLFGRTPAASVIMGGLVRKTRDHSSFRLECQSTRLVSAGKCVVVVTTGFTHLRYSRHTIQQLYPHVLHNEDLVRKLVGRQLHVPFTMKMFFSERGRLVNVEIEPDFVAALYEVLRNAEECALLLGEARVKKFIVGQQLQLEDGHKGPS